MPFFDATATGGEPELDVFAGTVRTTVAATAVAVPTATASRRVMVLSGVSGVLVSLPFLMIDMVAVWRGCVKAWGTKQTEC